MAVTVSQKTVELELGFDKSTENNPSVLQDVLVCLVSLSLFSTLCSHQIRFQEQQAGVLSEQAQINPCSTLATQH